MQHLALLTLLLLALLLPFELESPWLDLGPLVLTNVELLLWLALALAFLHWWREGRPPLLPASMYGGMLSRLWLGMGLLWLALLFLAALLAPDFQLNAFKAAVRTLSGVGLALAVLVTVRRPGDLHRLAAALLAGGLLAALAGLVEIVAGVAQNWLLPFRTAPTVAGPFLRLAGPFDYANQAAMFIEATIPLLLAFCWLAWRQQRRRLLLLFVLLLVFYLQAAILTFSRASFFTLLLVNLALALLLSLPARSRFLPRFLAGTPRRPLAALTGGFALLTLLLIAANSLFNPVFRLRFSSESDNDWYLVHFEVPARLELTAGEQQAVSVSVTNQGAFTWRAGGSRQVNLGARWLHPQSGLELSQRPRWELPYPVPPGATVTIEVPLEAPDSGGEYRLIWDMVQEQVVWFGAKTGREASSLVTVSGSSAASAALPAPGQSGEPATGQNDAFEAAWDYQSPIPGRLALWQAAWQLWQERPLLGVGLDNFRLLYGRPLGYQGWNTTIHTNNWFMETFVSLGLLGGLPFLLWLALLLLDIARRLRLPTANVWQVALAAGLLAYLVHGLLDYFLLFNATGLLFWLLLALWLAATGRLSWQEQAA